MALLGLLVWTFIPGLALSVNLTDSGQVKNWLTSSNTYQNFVDQSLQFVEAESGKAIGEENQSSAINTTDILRAAQPVLSVDFVQEQAENFIDGMYRWLKGDTVTPEFNISLSSKSEQVAELIQPEIAEQLSKLPPCTPDQVQGGREIDLTELECLPPGIDVQQESQKLTESIVTQADGIFKTEFTGSDLNLGNDTVVNAPIAYNSLELMPTFFWAFLLGVSTITVLTARRWQRGLKEIGSTMAVSSGVLIVFSFISIRLAGAPGKYVINSDGTDAKSMAARSIVEPLAKVVTADIAKTTMMFAGIVFAIGAVCFLIGWYFGRTPKAEQATTPADPAAPGTPPADQPSAAPNNQAVNDVPELMRDDNHMTNFIDEAHKEKTQKPKLRDKIKRKLIQ
jgi:hypothetical protein